jgi:hypothetical protein
MKKHILPFIITTLFAAAIAGVPTLSRAQDTNAAAPSNQTNAPVQKKHSLSVANGKVSALDATAMTLTVGKRTFEINSDTKINKDGKPAVLGDISVGDKVGISYKKSDDGKLTAMTVNDGKGPKEQ